MKFTMVFFQKMKSRGLLQIFTLKYYFRIEMIEPLDERELLTQLLEHYCLVYAFKDDTKNREALAHIVVK